MKLNRNKNLVSYSRSLAEARYYLTPLEQKLVWAMCSLINSKDDEDFRTYRIEVASLADYIGIDKKSSLRELDRVTDSLMSRVLRIPVDDGEKLLKVHWVSHCLMSDKCVEFSFHPKMKPYLLKLRRQFASHRFNTIVSFRGGYTIRLYQLLKVYLFEGKYKCSVEQLREILEVGGAYKEFKEFKRNVLMPAKKEFEKKNKEAGGYMSDLTFDLETLRTGRRITDLVFHIRKQSYQESLPLELPMVEMAGEDTASLLSTLEKYGLKQDAVQVFLDEQGEDEILRCVSLLERAKHQGKIRTSEAGYLLKLLKERAGLKTPSELDAEKKEALLLATNQKLKRQADQAQKHQEKLDKLAAKQVREDYLATLSDENRTQLLDTLRQENPESRTFITSLTSGLGSALLVEKIPDFEKRKKACLGKKLAA